MNGLKVRVKDNIRDNFIAFYEHARRRSGDVFVLQNIDQRRELFAPEKKLVANDEEAKAIYEQIKDKDGLIPQDFSFRWMEVVSLSTPERVSTAQENMDRRSDTIRLEKAAARAESEPAGGEPKKDVI